VYWSVAEIRSAIVGSVTRPLHGDSGQDEDTTDQKLKNYYQNSSPPTPNP